MKFKKLSKGNIIAIAMAAVLAVGGIGAYRVSAATLIDPNYSIKIQANVVDENGEEFFEHYQGDVVVNLYKIADMEANGDIGAVSTKFAGAGIDLDYIKPEKKPTVNDIKANIVDKAVKTVRTETGSGKNLKVSYAEPDYTITIHRGENEVVASTAVDKGLYLYVPVETMNARYKYTFTPYVIMAPTSLFIQAGAGSDDWFTDGGNTYLSEFNLKAQEEARFGDLEIDKTLSSYNTSLGTASFVYTIEATLDGELVFSDVASIDFNKAGEGSAVVKDIPAGSDVVVTEVYTGASYKVSIDSADKQSTTIVANDLVKVAFKNSYDDRLEVGGASVVNTYTASMTNPSEEDKLKGVEPKIEYTWSNNLGASDTTTGGASNDNTSNTNAEGGAGNGQ